MNEKTLKKIDIIFLILLPTVAAITALTLKVNYFNSILLFFGLPAVWFSYRTPKMIKKAFVFSFITSAFFSTVVNYIAVVSDAWFVPQSIFPRFLNVLPIEDFIFGIFLIYGVIILYEHFLEKGKHGLVDHHVKYFILPFIIMTIIFFAVVFTKPELLIVKYAYLKIGIIFLLIPSIAMLVFFPRLLSKYIKVGAYYFLVTALFEITGLQLNHWTFPGQQFIGWVTLFGYKFPYEEFLFWFVMTVITILSYYEFFADDRR